MNIILGLIIILTIIYIWEKINWSSRPLVYDSTPNNLSESNQYNYAKPDTFVSYPYNPPIPTLQSNYDNITKQINKDNEYKSNLSIGISPIPFYDCVDLSDEKKCNESGCNWFGTFCSSIYPSYL
jgi:hypothetical protein